MEIIKKVEEARIESEASVFWSKIAEYLPKSFERSALGDHVIYEAFFQAYLEFRAFFIKQQKENIINDIKEKWEDWEDISRVELIKLLKSNENN